jgi:hypothetical protein
MSHTNTTKGVSLHDEAEKQALSFPNYSSLHTTGQILAYPAFLSGALL